MSSSFLIFFTGFAWHPLPAREFCSCGKARRQSARQSLQSLSCQMKMRLRLWIPMRCRSSSS